MTQGGPQTPGGKSVSRWNSSTHGLTSPSPVIPALEKEEDWEAHREGVLQSLGPEGQLEQVLAERVALQSWRLHRVTRHEQATVATAQNSVEEDFHEAEENRGRSRLEDAKYHLERMERQRDFSGCLAGFEEGRSVAPESAAQTVYLARSIAGSVVGEELGRMKLPDIPRAFTRGDLSQFKSWTAGTVKGAINAYAERAGLDFDDLLERVRAEARERVEQAKAAIESREQEIQNGIDRLSHERLLPDGKALEKIARYEAHLSRQMYQALHELEALQTRRAGGAAPLGRLDVQGNDA